MRCIEFGYPQPFKAGIMGLGFCVGCRQSLISMQATAPFEIAEPGQKVGWFRKDVAYFLRRSRINAGLKQSEAGAVINVSRSPISSLENGEREFGLYEFFTLLQAYDVPVIIGILHAMLIYQERRPLVQADWDMLKMLICEMKNRGHSLPVILTGTEYGRPPVAMRYPRN